MQEHDFAWFLGITLEPLAKVIFTILSLITLFSRILMQVEKVFYVIIRYAKIIQYVILRDFYYIII